MMIKKQIYIIFFSLSFTVFAQSANYKIVAYLPDYRILAIDTSIGKYIDDLIYFNLRFDTSANLTREAISDQGIELVSTIKEKYNIRTQICIGGVWSHTAEAYPHVTTNDSLRAILVQNVLNFCLDNNFDGVDYDWEHPKNEAEINGYIELFKETKIAFEPYGMIVSAAVDSDFPLPLEGYEPLDKIHIMSYRSYISDIDDCVHFMERDIPREKLYMGTPFFGRDNSGDAHLYKNLIATYDMPPEFDNYAGVSYEGIFTQEAKVFYSHKHNFGGLMIWEVGQDSQGDKSLLKAIDNTVQHADELQAPASVSVFSTEVNKIKVEFSSVSGASNYLIRYGLSSNQFSDSVMIAEKSYTFTELDEDSLYYFQVVAVDENGNYGISSKVMAATPKLSETNLLIVNDFDSWRKPLNLISRHSELFIKSGYTISSAFGGDISELEIAQNEYKIIDWFVGDKGYYDTAITAPNRELIGNYIESGGNLLLSGSNIGYDLYIRGSMEEKLFSLAYLKSTTKMDAPEKKFSEYYSIQSVPNSIFDGIGEVHFDNGEYGSYNVYNPDVLYTGTYSDEGFQYSDYDNNIKTACNYYSGNFGDSQIPGKMIFFTIPLEAIYPDSSRENIVEKIISYFDQTSAVAVGSSLPTEMESVINYPNPFNSETIIEYVLQKQSSVELKIYNVLGELVGRFSESQMIPGVHQYHWNAKDLPSGVYYYNLTTELNILNGKMIYVK